MTPGGVRRRDRYAVRAARLLFALLSRQGYLCPIDGRDARATILPSYRRVAIECLQLIQINRLDVSANAALAKGQRHPGFEMPDNSWFHFRVASEIEIQTIGPRIHQ